LSNIDSWLGEFFELNPDSKESDNAEEAKSYKLDLFRQVLPAIDRQDKFYYRNLNQDEKDSIEPWILMRWLASADSNNDQPHYLLSVNDFVNANFSVLAPLKTMGKAGHKELQWMLLTLCGTGKSPRRKFIKPGKGATKNKLEEEILKFYPMMKDDELELLLEVNTTEELEDFFMSNGYDNKTIKELLKADAKRK